MTQFQPFEQTKYISSYSSMIFGLELKANLRFDRHIPKYLSNQWESNTYQKRFKEKKNIN